MRPEPAAPSRSPAPRTISTCSPNGQACTSASFRWMTWPRKSVRPSKSRTIAPTAPASPASSPSIMNGPRMNQFVAPTSFITSISRRRAKIESRIVFAISRVEEMNRTANAISTTAQR